MEKMSVRRGAFKLWVLVLNVWLVSSAARADAVLDWNTIAVNTAVANKQSPYAQARYVTIAQLAVFEAVNAITHDYQTLYWSQSQRRRAPQPKGRPLRPPTKY